VTPTPGTPTPDTVDQLLATLAARQIALTVIDGRLRCDAPRGALTAELRDQLASMKDAILARLPDASDRIPLAPRDPRGLPLSGAQYRLWLLDRLEGGSPRYNLVSATRLRIAVDLDAAKRALAAVVARHEILRTRFEFTDDEVRQLAVARCDVTLEPEILAGLEEGAREGSIARVVR